MSDLVEKVLQALETSRKEEKEYQDYIVQVYGQEALKKITRFFISTKLQDLKSMTKTDMHTLLLTHDAGPFFQVDEPSVLRSQTNYEQNLVASYFFSDPRNSLHTPFQTSVDVVCARKEMPTHLATRLKESGMDPHALIDFEVFEYPHYAHEYYYGLQYKDRVSELLQNVAISGKDIAKLFRSKKSPLYRDTEKIHVQFAVVKNGKHFDFLPVYIGIGTNEPYQLSEEGAFGKVRFLKYNFLDDTTGIETWNPKKKPCPPKTFRELVDTCDLEHTYEDPKRIVASIIQKGEHQCKQFSFGIYDEHRFKGFIEYDKETKQTTFLIPSFSATHINPHSYFTAFKTNQRHINNHPLPRTLSDITALLSTALDTYEYYSATALDPQYLVRKHGIDTCFEATAHKLDSGDFSFVSSINVASDIYALGVDSWHRLKCASLLFAQLETYGELQKILLEKT